jgi:hypothetical protein
MQHLSGARHHDCGFDTRSGDHHETAVAKTAQPSMRLNFGGAFKLARGSIERHHLASGCAAWAASPSGTPQDAFRGPREFLAATCRNRRSFCPLGVRFLGLGCLRVFVAGTGFDVLVGSTGAGAGLRRRTPTPPSFSAMKMIPASIVPGDVARHDAPTGAPRLLIENIMESAGRELPFEVEV